MDCSTDQLIHSSYAMECQFQIWYITDILQYTMQSGIRVWSIRDIVLICAGSEITYVTAVSTWRLSFTGTANRELQSWDRAGSEQEVETKGIRKIELLKIFF